MTFDDVFDD